MYKYNLVSEAGRIVHVFNDFRKAKIHQCLAAVRGVMYTIEPTRRSS